MPKILEFDEDARRSLERGVNALADTVVRRGDTPLPVRTPLTVQLPEPMAAQLRAATEQAAAQQGQTQPATATSPVQTAMNLWNSYGPAVMGYMNKNKAAEPVATNPAAAASTTSFQSQASVAQPRTPYAENLPNPHDSGAAPSFPQPSI